jgi:hypothetical protein
VASEVGLAVADHSYLCIYILKTHNGEFRFDQAVQYEEERA